MDAFAIKGLAAEEIETVGRWFDGTSEVAGNWTFPFLSDSMEWKI